MMSSLIIDRLSIKLRSGSDNLVSEISFAIKEGESLILLGQSGSGKTMTCSAVLNLLDPKKFEVSGSVFFGETDLLNSSEKQRRGIYGNQIVYIPQNPMTALDPSMRIGRQMDETLRLHSDKSRQQRYNYILQLLHTTNIRNIYKQHRWGGMSSGSIFDWEPLNDIQCVYLPPLRDAEHALKSGRGSRLARLIANLSEDKLKETRNQSKKMQLEIQLEKFNSSAAQDDEIIRASQLINESLEKSAGAVYGQKTVIQFNQLTYERIIESLQILFFPKGNSAATVNLFRSLSENSLGYNNLIYIATILAEFEGLKDKYTTPRILLVEELEAHLHPQLQIKLLNYLQEQARENDIQVIITTHSVSLASAVQIDSIISFNQTEVGIEVVPLRNCGVEEKSKKFIERWMDATKSNVV